MAEQVPYQINRTRRSFLLEQVNHPKSRDEDWRVWEDPSFKSRDLPPHEAAHSVRHREGANAFERFHRALFRAHHERDRDLTDRNTLVDLAGSLDLNEDALRRDLREGRFRSTVGEEHEEGVRKHGIFGVPTILFNGTQPIFLKLAGGDWEGTEDRELFESIHETAATRPYLLTVKKPTSASDRPPADELPR